MKRGPTKATMERLFTEQAAKRELVTDWIPCTTPPVRDGVYECQPVDRDFDHIRLEFSSGSWRIISGFLAGVSIAGPNLDPKCFQWRGVRRWVLQRPADNRLSLISHEPITIYLHASRPRSTKWSGLEKARPFKTEKAAQRFADSRPRLKLTAVLP